MTAPAVERTGNEQDAESGAPLAVLSELAPSLIPLLYEIGERTWPRRREYKRRKFGVVGPEETVRQEMPRRFDVLLRKRDLATLALSWRLEAAGPVEFFEWDDSGQVGGTYGVRQPVISVAPVIDGEGRQSGFAVNARPSSREDGVVDAIDARLDCAAFVRSHDPVKIAEAVRAVAGSPRAEEFRPGMEPTAAYFQVLQLENKASYFLRHGANEYVGTGWTPDSIRKAFHNPVVRALVIGNPAEPTLTPEPMEH